MIGESSHSNASTVSPQYEEIIQELSSLCTSSSVTSEAGGIQDASFFQGELGSHAFIQYSTWKAKRKAHPENIDEDEELLHLAKAVVQGSLERRTSDSKSLSVWTNPSFGAHILLTAIYHQLEQGEASYQELDQVEDFLDGCIDKLTTEGAEVTCDVMNGLAGTLQGIFFVRRELQRPDWAKKVAIRIATEILERGKKNSEARSKFSTTAPLYWGKVRGETDWTMSTGCAGILQSLLGLEINEWNEIEKTIPNALESLLEQTIKQLPAYGKANFYSKSKTKSGRTMDGASGHAILLLQCYVVLGSMDYLKQAQRLVRNVILPWCSAFMTDSSCLREDTVLGLFDGVVGICFCLWLSKERETVRKLINMVIPYCRKQLKTSGSIDLSLANGAAGFVRLLQQIDSRGRDEVEIPFLSSALFNFDMEFSMPLAALVSDSSSLHERRKKRNEMKQMSRRNRSLPTRHTSIPVRNSSLPVHAGADKPARNTSLPVQAGTDSSSGHMRRNYQMTSLTAGRRWTSSSDLDEDSHMSVSSFSMDEKPRIHSSSIQFPNMRAKRRASNAHSISSTSYSLKEEDEDVKKTKQHGSSAPTAHDDSDDSSSFSTSSHMENATVDDQANAQYLAKQDSDNEEYIYANVSVSLLPGRSLSGTDSDSSLDKSQRKRPPIDRLSLFSKTRNQNLNVDSDSDSINDIEPPPVSRFDEATPSTSNRKSLNSSLSSRETQKNPRSMLRSPKPQMHRWMSSSKRNLMAGMEDDEPAPQSMHSRSSGEKDRRKKAPPIAAPKKSSLDDGYESTSESLNDDNLEPVVNDDGLAISRPDEMPDQKYLDTHDVSSRPTSRSVSTEYKPPRTQKKTLMDEECHGVTSVGRAEKRPSARFLQEAALQEAENESESDTLNDEGTVGDDLAMGAPDDMPSAAYLAMHDVSTRTRTYDPMQNYKPPAVQKKTLMDEEGHTRGTRKEKVQEEKMRSLHEESIADGSESMNDDDERTEGGDDLAIGSPDELPDSAYLDSMDISTRTQSHDPYTNYKPVAAQKKTLMDEEGHGSSGGGPMQTRPSGALSKKNSSNHSASDTDDDIEDDGMEIGLPNDLPDTAYLDTHDVSTRTRSYNPYASYKPVNRAQQKTLMDEEGHGQHVSSDSDDDSRSIESMHGGLDLNEKPNAEYLARQDSFKDDYYDYKSTTTTMPTHDLLDDEDHVLVQPKAPVTSLDSFIAEEAGHDDKPNKNYLARQDSEQNEYFEYSPKTTKMPSHQIDGSDSKADNLSSIEAEIEAALKNET